MTTIIAAIVGALITAVVSGIVLYIFGIEQSRYERLEQKRAEAITELSRLLFVVQDNYHHWSYQSLIPPESEIPDRQAEKGRAAVESNNELIRYFRANEAVLPSDIAKRIEHFINLVQEVSHQYAPNMHMGDIGFQWSPEGHRIATRMRMEIPPLRDQLIEEFRTTLDPPSLWQKWRLKFFPYRIIFKPPQNR